MNRLLALFVHKLHSFTSGSGLGRVPVKADYADRAVCRWRIERYLVTHSGRAHGEERLDVLLSIDNEPGAAGTTGYDARRARSTGWLRAHHGNMGTHGAAPAQYPDLKYDPINDSPLSALPPRYPAVIVTEKTFQPIISPSSSPTSVQTRTRSMRRMSVRGHRPCLLHALLQSMLGISTGRVAYRGRGGAQAMNDLNERSRRLQLYFIERGNFADPGRNIESDCDRQAHGARTLFQMSRQRPKAGCPNLSCRPGTGSSRQKIWLLKCRTNLNHALAKALDDATVRKRLTEIGFVIPDATKRAPQVLQDLVASEVPRWRSVVATPLAGRN